MSNGDEPQQPNRTMFGMLIDLLGKVGGVLSSIKGIAVAVGVLLPSLTTAVSVVFGGGSPALEGAIRDERAAETVLADAQEECTIEAADFVCQNDPESYKTDFSRNNLEDAIESGFRTGTLIAVEKWTKNVASLEDLPSWTIPHLENELEPNIRAAIRDNTDEDPETVAGALAVCGYFAGEHSYAHLVEDLANKRVTRRALEGTPDLVEKPKWWRDWLLGGGFAVGGMMVGGAVVAFVWERKSRRPASDLER